MPKNKNVQTKTVTYTNNRRRNNTNGSKKVVVIRKNKRRGRVTPKKQLLNKQVLIKARSIPIAKASSISVKRPAQIKSTKLGIRIKHREYLTTIGSSTDLSYIQFRINPGDVKTFPFLAPIAASYEKYKIHNLKMMYIPNCATISQGSFISYIEYDPNDTPLKDVSQILNQLSCANTPVWQKCTIPYIKKKNQQVTEYYVRNDWTSYNDLKLYDPAYIFVGTYSSGDISDLGKIYIDYDIELTVPDYSNRPPMLNAVFSFTSCPVVAVQNNGNNPAGAIQIGNAQSSSYSVGNLKVFPTITPGLGYPCLQFGDDYTGMMQVYLAGGNQFPIAEYNLNNFFTFLHIDSNTNVSSNYTAFVIDWNQEDSSFSSTDWYIVTAHVKVSSGDYWLMPNTFTSSAVGVDTATLYCAFAPVLYKYMFTTAPDAVSYFNNGYTLPGSLQVHTGSNFVKTKTRNNKFLENMKKFFPQFSEMSFDEDDESSETNEVNNYINRITAPVETAVKKPIKLVTKK